MNESLSHVVSEELLAQARRGVPNATQQLWNICWPKVNKISVRILGDGFTANEVSVETMTQFLSKYIHTIKSAKAVRTYVQLVAVHLATKEKQRQTKNTYSEMNEFAATTEGYTPEECVSYKLLIPRLEKCLTKLSPKAQMIVKLRFFRGKTNNDIGELVGVSKQYVGKLLSKVITVLRKCIERPGVKTPITQEGGGF